MIQFRFQFLFLLFAYISILNAQSNYLMFTSPIQYEELTRKKFRLLTSSYDLMSSRQTCSGDDIYTLKDGRVIFDIAEMRALLFASKSDYEEYIRWSEAPAAELRALMEIADTQYLDKLLMYYALAEELLISEFEFTPNLSSLNTYLDRLGAESVRRYRLAFIAYIGELYRKSNPQMNWVAISMFGKYESVALSDGSTIYSPPALLSSYIIHGTSFE